jgi:hypothetical protein
MAAHPKATGPTTPAGKAKVSKNALTHGLRARKWLTTEEQEDFAALMQDLVNEYQPQTATEQLMVERIAVGMTKLRRLQQVEDAMYAKARLESTRSNMIRSEPLDRQLIVDAAMPPIKVLDTLARYQTSLDRQISKTIGELLVLQDRSKAAADRLLTTLVSAAGSKPPAE